jgi:hypothetical protein
MKRNFIVQVKDSSYVYLALYIYELLRLNIYILNNIILYYMSNLYTNYFYNTYSKNIYSQNGEDGIVEELLKRLNINNGWVCEFGAWDGIHLSNTFNLVKKGFMQYLLKGM